MNNRLWIHYGSLGLLAVLGCSSPAASTADGGEPDTAAGGKNLAEFIGVWERTSGTFSQGCVSGNTSGQDQGGTQTLTISAASAGSGADLMFDIAATGGCVLSASVSGDTAVLVPPSPECSGTIAPGITAMYTITADTLTVTGTTMNVLQKSTIMYFAGSTLMDTCYATVTQSYAKETGGGHDASASGGTSGTGDGGGDSGGASGLGGSGSGGAPSDGGAAGNGGMAGGGAGGAPVACINGGTVLPPSALITDFSDAAPTNNPDVVLFGGGSTSRLQGSIGTFQNPGSSPGHFTIADGALTFTATASAPGTGAWS